MCVRDAARGEKKMLDAVGGVTIMKQCKPGNRKKSPRHYNALSHAALGAGLFPACIQQDKAENAHSTICSYADEERSIWLQI